jgi:hypothetical protein
MATDYTNQNVLLHDGREAWVEGRVPDLIRAGKLGRSGMRIPDTAWYVKIRDEDGVSLGHIVLSTQITKIV